jgi:multiple sugar transport system substrate-binding protein
MMNGGKFIQVFLCCLLLCHGCGGHERDKAITFSVGGAPYELAYWDRLVEEFQAETGVRVSLLRQPTATDQRRQGLVISLAAGKSDPDIFLMDVVWIAQFAASDWLEPLDENIERDRLDLTAFFPNVLNLADRYRGKLIALPVYVDGGVLYYRKDLLAKAGFAGAPRTWEQLLTYALQVQQEARESNPDFWGFVWQGAQYEGLICSFLEFAGSNGGGIILENGRILLNTPENRTAAQFMRDLIHRRHISPPSTYTEVKEEEARIAFQQGNALFERNWPYAWPLHQSESSPVRGKTGISTLPHFPAGSSVATLGGWHIGISKFSDDKQSAWEFVRYVASYETQKKLALELGWNPGRRKLYEDPEVLRKLPHFAELKEVFENALPRPTVPYYAQLSEIIQQHLNSMLAGSVSPEQALARAEKDAQKVITRYTPQPTRHNPALPRKEEVLTGKSTGTNP